MRVCRATMIWLVVLGALALFGAPGALAAGPSAGDQQYVDPLGGSSTSSSQSPPPSSSTSASATPAATASSAVASTSTTTTTSTDSTTASSAATLPRTGYDGWLAALIGVGLAGTGLAIRRQALSR